MASETAESIVARISDCLARKAPVDIVGGGSKRFLGHPPGPDQEPLDVSSHAGIISYEPRELVLRARAGTRIDELNATLAGQGQMLGFEPPDYDGAATLGGTIAAAAAGPRRPWYGAPRDFVLGVGLVTGAGKQLAFGGQVMKNVAGFDVSRLVVGSMGTLGVVTDISLKVLPAPAAEITVVRECNVEDAHRTMLSLSGRASPLSGACHVDDLLYLRFSGSEHAIRSAAAAIGGDEVSALETAEAAGLWRSIANLSHTRLREARELWRVAVPATSTTWLAECTVLDWGGGLRWIADPDFDPRAGLVQGHATLVKSERSDVPRFQPLAGELHRIHRALKREFDPARILNPGRLYEDL